MSEYTDWYNSLSPEKKTELRKKKADISRRWYQKNKQKRLKAFKEYRQKHKHDSHFKAMRSLRNKRYWKKNKNKIIKQRKRRHNAGNPGI